MPWFPIPQEIKCSQELLKISATSYNRENFLPPLIPNGITVVRPFSSQNSWNDLLTTERLKTGKKKKKKLMSMWTLIFFLFYQTKTIKSIVCEVTCSILSYMLPTMLKTQTLTWKILSFKFGSSIYNFKKYVSYRPSVASTESRGWDKDLAAGHVLRRWFQETGVKEQGEWGKRGNLTMRACYPSLCGRHRESVWLGLLESMNFFQNFPSEGSKDEAWLPHWFMADIFLGSRNRAHLRAMFIHISHCSRAGEAQGRKQNNSVSAWDGTLSTGDEPEHSAAETEVGQRSENGAPRHVLHKTNI